MRMIVFGVALATALPLLAAPPLDRLRVPDGFEISLFADKVDNARGMAWGDNGTLFVGTREKGQVYAVRDDDGDGRADSVKVIAKGLRMPVGLAFRDGALYVSAVDRIVRFDAIESRLDKPAKPVVVVSDLPDKDHHGWRYIAFGPDGKLYVPLGAPCNICDEPGFASITRMNADGSGREVVARGVRNSVGFDWNPADGKLWFTDNGRDWLGDDVPDDEINIVATTGEHFGYPYCHAGSILDPEFGAGKSCADYRAPTAKLGAHVAALGLRFYTGSQFPAEYNGDAFVALHGSWNRSKKSGYAVKRVQVVNGQVSAVTPFVEGFLDGEKTLGRPVDVIQASDGSLLISDDYANAIYRVRYVGGK
ncbi:MAG: sorbosone dehydrogenase family protein [Xanthomonadaceae bacterium]|nr:sorbosone dehydrogenase family protein [Xanthomonadaceae bacterium]MDP2186616.1 sorbosone dehydrogenase family protein [Xanthomonadales bacterium]MDZ4114556.1 sorbosone dehydrogenase family protein [Xanthomonadaceae bacterium]MDZ4378314.1 sorbosone dehydrogenase family protein [Xanthomonadaceae bacterium]